MADGGAGPFLSSVRSLSLCPTTHTRAHPRACTHTHTHACTQHACQLILSTPPEAEQLRVNKRALQTHFASSGLISSLENGSGKPALPASRQTSAPMSHCSSPPAWQEEQSWGIKSLRPGLEPCLHHAQPALGCSFPARHPTIPVLLSQ